MGVKVTVDVDLMSKLGPKAQNKALTAAATQLGTELTDYNTGVVPLWHGDLRGTATPSGADVDFDSAYAAAQFNGGYTKKDGTKVVFHHWRKKGTGPHWDKMIEDNDQKMSRIREAYLKGLNL